MCRRFLPWGSEGWSCGFQTFPGTLSWGCRLPGSLAGSRPLGQPLRSRPATQKAGFPGCSETPFTAPPATCQARPAAGTRRRAGAQGPLPRGALPPPRKRREANFGGGGGGELRGPPPPRCREGPRRRPGSLLEAAEEGSGRGAPLRGRVPENCSKATAGTPQSVR